MELEKGAIGSIPSRAEVQGLTGLAEETSTWDATETAARIAAKDISAVEAAEAAIARAVAWEPLINAIVARTFEAGLAQARKSASGCFAGVPTFVKDMEDLTGAPTRLGSAALPPMIAKTTAESVAQFLSSGAVPLGKSTTSEFGLTATTEPVHGEPTRNPINLEHSSGGSSGGAAALVAAGVVPVAHGGDGGGSIRVPASFCGLVGLKATRGRLKPMESTKRMPVKLATYGILTRTVRDTAAFFAQVDQAPVRGMAPVGLVEGPGKQRHRVGLFIDPPQGADVHPEVREAVMATAEALERMGHRVDLVSAPYDRHMVDDFLLYWGLLAAGVERIIAKTPGGDVTRLEPWTRALAATARANWLRLPGALWRLHRYKARYACVFDRCDVLLSPTVAQPAPKLGHLAADQPFEQKKERLLNMLPYTPVQNVSGGPAISIPVATSSSGLPIGVQIAAPWGEERRLIELAFALEG